jgi:lipopolysaccharide export system permease protein
MRLSLTLSRYIAKHFFLSVLLGLFGLVAIITLVDMIELLRRASGRDGVPFSVILEMTFLRVPFNAERLTPYAVIVGTMLALTRLTRTHELIVARAAGVSVWQFLAPAISVVLMLGIFVSTVFNPLSSAMLMHFERLESRYIANNASMLSISSSGLWLRQLENNKESPIAEHIINAARISQKDFSFSKVIIFSFDKDGRFVERLDADRATLLPGKLQLDNAVRSLPGQPLTVIPSIFLPTTLTMEHIQDSFASPETMSFWSLPGFISTLEEAGFSALKHRLYWYSLLANPFLMAGTVWVAAVFSLRLPRRGKVGILVVAGLVSGFVLHFFTDIVHAFGAGGTLPVFLAAWAPALVVSMIGAALLLHVEDG